jgi:hypothetical protein
VRTSGAALAKLFPPNWETIAWNLQQLRHGNKRKYRETYNETFSRKTHYIYEEDHAVHLKTSAQFGKNGVE